MKVTNIKFYESLSREAYVFHAKGRIDMKKLIVAVHNFWNAYKKEIHERRTTPPTPLTLLPRIFMHVGKEKEERWVRDRIIDYSLSIDPLIHNIRWGKVDLPPQVYSDNWADFIDSVG